MSLTRQYPISVGLETKSVKSLYLARQMIARRLGFSKLNNTFTGDYVSQSAKSDYEDGQHYLLLPFVRVLLPPTKANASDDQRTVFKILGMRASFLIRRGKIAAAP